jgi:hypothetical protein
MDAQLSKYKCKLMYGDLSRFAHRCALQYVPSGIHVLWIAPKRWRYQMAAVISWSNKGNRRTGQDGANHHGKTEHVRADAIELGIAIAVHNHQNIIGRERSIEEQTRQPAEFIDPTLCDTRPRVAPLPMGVKRIVRWAWNVHQRGGNTIHNVKTCHRDNDLIVKIR